MECDHVFVGRSDGVHCQKCGLHLSGREYVKLLNRGKPEEKPEKPRRKKVVEP